MALHAAVAAPLVTASVAVPCTNLLKSRTDPFSAAISGQIPKFGESDSPCSSAVGYGNNRRGVGLWPALRGPWAAEQTYIQQHPCSKC